MNGDILTTIKERISFPDLVAETVTLKRRPSDGRPALALCPFHQESTPSFAVYTDGGHCFGCGWHGDIFDWVQARDGLDFRGALEVLARRAGVDLRPLTPEQRRAVEERPAAPPAARPAARDVEPPNQKWQARARAFVTWCQAKLWEPLGREALEYLYWRGLTDETIKAAGLGYNPQRWRRPAAAWGLAGEPVNLAAGVVIPHEVEGDLWAIKIRLLEPFQTGDGRMVKYTGARGGKGALYGADTLTGDKAAVVLTEGEFDALLLRQQAGDLADVATLTGAAHGLALRWLVKLLPYRRILAAYDADEAGQKGAAKLAARSKRVAVIRPLEGKDVTDFYLAGGDLRAWIGFNLARLGL